MFFDRDYYNRLSIYVYMFCRYFVSAVAFLRSLSSSRASCLNCVPGGCDLRLGPFVKGLCVELPTLCLRVRCPVRLRWSLPCLRPVRACDCGALWVCQCCACVLFLRLFCVFCDFCRQKTHVLLILCVFFEKNFWKLCNAFFKYDKFFYICR